ncbi:MAG: 50S ribosomal protein L9 [Candidatus Omnitrophota bacterium]
MKIILKKDVEKIGKLGQVIEAKAGFARNYLFPKDLAVEYSQKNLKGFEIEKRKAQELAEKKKQDAMVLAEKLNTLSCTVKVKTGEEGKLFGVVNTADIAQALKSEGIEIDKRDILLDEPLKALGIYQVAIRLHPEIKTEIRLWVVKE